MDFVKPLTALLAFSASAVQAQTVPVPTPPIPPGNIFFDYFLFDNAGQPADGFGDPAKPLQAYLLWNVTDGTTDLVGGNLPGFDDLPNGRFVDLGGSTNDPGRMATRQEFPFAPALTYNLFFEYRSTDGNPASARIDVAGRQFTVSTSSTAFLRFDETFAINAALTSPILTPIVFQDLGNDNSGIGIDAVLLNIVPPVIIPEPASLGLLGVGALLIARRRRQA